MTIAFAKELKARLGCSACSSPAQADRKFCGQHLAAARANWHRHVDRCKLEGRCINCANPKLRAEQRCQACKGDNRVMCRAWWLANRERLQARYRERLARGLCGSCGLRKPVKGFVACKFCRPKRYAR